MANVAYLLGAGASAKKIPLVNSFVDKNGAKVNGLSQSMRELSNSLQVDINQNQLNNALRHCIQYSQEFANDLKFFADKSDEFGSIDTYAKKLFLLDEKKELNKLKTFLSLYFSLLQSDKVVDSRYNSFFAKILIKSPFQVAIPNSIDFISWNYDIQLELSLSNYNTRENSTFDLDDIFYQTDSLHYNDQAVASKIVHLNGMAGLLYKNRMECQSSVGIIEKALEDLWPLAYIHNFKIDTQKNGLNPTRAFTFAWELDKNNQLLQRAQHILRNAQYLVIIGYSFPFFNRDIDTQLIQEFCRSDSHGRKIFLQNPSYNKEFFKSQFGVSSIIEIVEMEQVDQFHLPI